MSRCELKLYFSLPTAGIEKKKAGTRKTFPAQGYFDTIRTYIQTYPINSVELAVALAFALVPVVLSP